MNVDFDCCLDEDDVRLTSPNALQQLKCLPLKQSVLSPVGNCTREVISDLLSALAVKSAWKPEDSLC